MTPPGRIWKGVDLVLPHLEACDVVIIGSGAGGGTMANELTAAGLDVVILEEGPHLTKDDFHQREDVAFSRVYGGRGLETTEDASVNVLYAKLVGGTTVVYWADTYRAPEARLARWAADFGVVGRDAAAMGPFYAHCEALVNMRLPGDVLVNENNRLLRAGAEKLGWAAARVPGARNGCVTSGHCMQGCSYDAKQSQLVTNVPRAVARGARVYADCRADRLIVEDGRARGVEATIVVEGEPRGAVRIRAQAVVLAAGGVGSPVFLLRAGQANRNGAVGQGLLLNPSPMTFSAFDHPIEMWKNVPATWAVEEFRDVRRDADGAYREGGYLLMANNLQPGSAAAVLPGFGARHAAWMARFKQLAGTYAILDDEMPGHVAIDEQGRPRFHYVLRGDDVLKARDFLAKSAQLMLAAGAREVLIPDGDFETITAPEQVAARVARADLRPGAMVFGGPHPLGTCRMGEDRATCVVDSRGEAHHLPGLFLADASVFPTSVGVDPSLTIMAFAAKTATHVAAAVRGGEPAAAPLGARA